MDFKKVNFKLWIKSYLWKIVLFFLLMYISTLFGQIFESLNIFLFGKMKNPSLDVYYKAISVISIKIPIYSLIVGVFFVWIFGKIYRKIEVKIRKLKIIKAIYGKDNKYVDITNRLNDIIENNKIKVVLSNAIAGDPIVGTPKEGRIIYKYEGIKKEILYKEGDVIELP